MMLQMSSLVLLAREARLHHLFVLCVCFAGAVEANEGDDEGDESMDLLLPSGCIVSEDNSIKYPDGCVRHPDGSMQLPDGRTLSADEYLASKSGRGEVLPDGCILLDSGCFEYPSGVVSTSLGELQYPDGSVKASPWPLPAPQAVSLPRVSSAAEDKDGSALEARIIELEKELGDVRSDLSDAERKLAEESSTGQATSADLESARQAMEELESALKEKEQELADARDLVQEAEGERESSQHLRSRVEELEAALADRDGQIEALQSSAASPAAAPTKEVSGTDRDLNYYYQVGLVVHYILECMSVWLLRVCMCLLVCACALLRVFDCV